MTSHWLGGPLLKVRPDPFDAGAHHLLLAALNDGLNVKNDCPESDCGDYRLGFPGFQCWSS
jgi:hypothetical protein